MTGRCVSGVARLGSVMVVIAALLVGGARWTRTAHSEDVPSGEKEGAGVRIDKVVIAVSDLGRMETFYVGVFDAKLRDVDLGGAKLKAGTLGGMEFILCPKEVAGVKADQNTIQLRFVVEDIASAVEAATMAGGQIIDEIRSAEGAKTASVRDPDGNSIELIQR